MEDCNFDTPSLISREASTAIKGLLMLLIVFGHVGMITTNFATGERTFFWHWLYSFHVYVFFILPFIYGYKRKRIADDIKVDRRGKLIDFRNVFDDLKHGLTKIGIPYCWFFLLSAVIFVTVGGGSFNLKGMLYAFLFGNQPLMDKYIGFNFVWFLPAMLALTVVKSLWYNSKSVAKGCMLFISVVLWLLAILKILPQVTAGMYVPFSLSQAFYYLLLGLSARMLLEKRSIKKMISWVVLIVVAITIIMYCQYWTHWPNVVSYTTLYRLILPVAMFLLLYGLSNWLMKSKLLNILGEYSLQIYLVHVYVINVLQVVLLHFLPRSVSLGIAIYVLVLAISIGLAIVMVKVPIINKVLFPRGGRR